MVERRILVVGNAPVDLVVAVTELPAAGAEVAASESLVATGGAYNVSVAAVRAGASVAFGGGHGTGPFGDLVRRSFADAGVALIQPRTTERDSGWLVAFVIESGARSFVTPPGTVLPMSPAMVGRLDPGPGDLVYLSGYVVAGTEDPALVEWAAGLPDDRTLFWDVGPSLPLIAASRSARLLARVDWLACNVDEARQTTGFADPARAARALRDRGARGSVLLHDGAAGCHLLQRDAVEPVHVPAPQVDVVDTNGAGDAHSGWFLAGIAAGMPAVEAAARANIAAAVSVTRRGPSTSPTLAELPAPA